MFKLFKKEDSHEFKPILAEIEDSPASPLALATFWIIFGVFVFAVLWMTLGEIDVVVTGRGKVIPKGNVKVLQPLETGVVKAILVEAGDYVKKGEPLMVIDSSLTEPELEAAKANLEHLELESDRIQANITGAAFVPMSAKANNESALLTQQQLYYAAQNSLHSKLEAQQQALERVEAQIQAARAEIAKNQSLLAIAEEKEARLQEVLDVIAKQEYEQVTESILTYRGNLDRLNQELAQHHHQQQQILAEMANIEQDFQKGLLTELSDKQKQISGIRAKHESTAFVQSRHQIVSPVNGYVNELFVHTVGGVVTPAEKLISVVPTQSKLLVVANVKNRDIGFVNVGMPVALKLDPFDFQKYGLIAGKVVKISKDSKTPEDDPTNPEQIYEVTIVPSKYHLMVEGRKEKISTGMMAQADIKVGKRKVIEFFIYPLIRYLNEGLSVR